MKTKTGKEYKARICICNNIFESGNTVGCTGFLEREDEELS